MGNALYLPLSCTRSQCPIGEPNRCLFFLIDCAAVDNKGSCVEQKRSCSVCVRGKSVHGVCNTCATLVRHSCDNTCTTVVPPAQGTKSIVTETRMVVLIEQIWGIENLVFKSGKNEIAFNISFRVVQFTVAALKIESMPNIGILYTFLLLSTIFCVAPILSNHTRLPFIELR
ncbi:hypothetical protein CLIB1423_04S03510 [[Candida] railenensis]|uniref:Uncharacterized protein n=1 Tax=[Candida] railenensis TaxID=45579 RepID=A0A9P0VX92_9ASCO|nr:hypothetical protein CLIB1423_04S03510 [[Candida] railenensis]